MRIFVKTKPNAYEARVEKTDESHFIVSVKEPPQNGLANKGIVKALADYFGVSPSRIILKKGFTSKNKVIEIL